MKFLSHCFSTFQSDFIAYEHSSFALYRVNGSRCVDRHCFDIFQKQGGPDGSLGRSLARTPSIMTWSYVRAKLLLTHWSNQNSRSGSSRFVVASSHHDSKDARSKSLGPRDFRSIDWNFSYSTMRGTRVANYDANWKMENVEKMEFRISCFSFCSVIVLIFYTKTVHERPTDILI